MSAQKYRVRWTTTVLALTDCPETEGATSGLNVAKVLPERADIMSCDGRHDVTLYGRKIRADGKAGNSYVSVKVTTKAEDTHYRPSPGWLNEILEELFPSST